MDPHGPVHPGMSWVPLVKGSESLSSVQLFATPWTVHGILQSRKLEWVAFPLSRGSSPTQELNQGLPHCRQILNQLSYHWSRRSNQSILKEISPKYLLEGLMLKLKLQYFGHLMRRTDPLEKTLMLGKIEGRRRG